MKMLRRIPQILRFIPGTAQDVRTYFMTLQYWLGGSDDNMLNLIRHVIDRTAAGGVPASRSDWFSERSTASKASERSSAR